MKKPFSLPQNDSLEPIFDMTPMIDMVFQLLIFFLLTLTFSEPVIDLTLPKAENAHIKEEEELVRIVIKKSGEIFIKDQLMEWEQIKPLLVKLKTEKIKKIIVIQADGGVYFEKFVSVIDLAKGVGLTDIAIVTEEPQKKE